MRAGAKELLEHDAEDDADAGDDQHVGDEAEGRERLPAADLREQRECGQRDEHEQRRRLRRAARVVAAAEGADAKVGEQRRDVGREEAKVHRADPQLLQHDEEVDDAAAEAAAQRHRRDVAVRRDVGGGRARLEVLRHFHQ